MAKAESIAKIKTLATAILQFEKGESLVTRSPWGSIDFKAAEADIKQAYSLAADLGTLPLEFLSDTASEQIARHMENIPPILKQIDDFKLEGDAASTRNNLVINFHSHIDALMNVAGPPLPYLLYKRGDIATNISNLENSIQKTQGLYAGAEKWVADKKLDIDTVLNAARDLASKSGAAVFGSAFKAQADALEMSATTWLKATGALAAITLTTALFIFFGTGLESAWPEAVQKMSTKLIILGALGGAAIWCGRIYRALKHQAALNRHRELSIQTLEAFRQAAVDDHVKDAVVLEATRSVFGAGATGYIEGSDANPVGLNVVDMTKNMGKSAK